MEEVPGGGPWTNVSGLKYISSSTSLNIYSAATTGACYNPQNSQIISNGFKHQLIGRCCRPGPGQHPGECR